jgi:hypothetical protein
MRQSLDIKVVLRTVEGKYLAGSALGWCFVADHQHATVFDYMSDGVEEQLAGLRKCHGLSLQAEPLPASEVYEHCDECQSRVMPFQAFFDGKRFLCAECMSKTQNRARHKNLLH